MTIEPTQIYSGRLRLGEFRATPTGFVATDAAGKLLGRFDDHRAATAAIVAASYRKPSPVADNIR